MSVPLVVLLGAGASRDAGAWTHASRIPPLTLDLFSGRYSDVLQDYELAHQAGRYIEHHLKSNDPPAFEAVLRSMEDSPHSHHRHMAVSVPYYLQELLYRVSDEQYRLGANYDRLIERLLTLPYVFFITLNYDVLLDRRLNAHHLLSGSRDYLSNDGWSLLKPHGSVNWHYELQQAVDPHMPPAQIDRRGDTIQMHAPNASLTGIRGGPASTATYPALALPLGPDDEIVMPDQHVRFLKQRINSAGEVDLLTVGYSGYDKEILKLITDAIALRPTRIRRVTVVSHDSDEAARVYQRLEEAGLGGLWADLSVYGFADWVGAGRLDYLVDHYGEGPTY